MTDFNEEMSKIMGIYNCDKFIQLIEDIYEIILLYDVDEDVDWVKDKVGEEDLRDVRIARTAYLLSRLADHHANHLKKVHRAAPGFWHRAEKISQKSDPGVA